MQSLKLINNAYSRRGRTTGLFIYAVAFARIMRRCHHISTYQSENVAAMMMLMITDYTDSPVSESIRRNTFISSSWLQGSDQKNIYSSTSVIKDLNPCCDHDDSGFWWLKEEVHGAKMWLEEEVVVVSPWSE